MNDKQITRERMTVKKTIKVIHVHFMHNKKNYYFGSISAIFKVFTEKELDATIETLRHRLGGEGSKHVTSRACFIRSHLIRSSVLEEE
jgi:hypothetical protein